MAWLMVIWISTGSVAGTYSAALNTLPQRFSTETACETSGKALLEKSKGSIKYACIPVTTG